MAEHETMRQAAPYPQALEYLVGRLSYRPGWTFRLADIDRGQGSQGLTLIITTRGYDSYHPGRGENYRVNHYMLVPPAAFDARSWQRWLLDQLLHHPRAGHRDRPAHLVPRRAERASMMAPLSTATYGKAPTMDITGLADRITAALEELRTAAGDLKGAAETGAPVSQAHVNTLNKTMGTLSELANDARQHASDQQQDQAAGAAPADDTGTGPASGSDTAAGPGPANAAQNQPSAQAQAPGATGDAGDATRRGTAAQPGSSPGQQG